MSTQVDPEEAEAILEAVGNAARSAPEVSQRDFSLPRRISSVQIEEFQRCLARCLPSLQESVDGFASEGHPVEIEGLSEISAEGLFEGDEGPFAMSRFAIGGNLGWITWDNLAALRTLETVLGSTSRPTEERPLSQVESCLLGEFLANIASLTASSFKLTCEDFHVVSEPRHIGDWRDVPGEPDPHRLVVTLSIGDDKASSHIHVYLPGFQGEPEGDLSALASVPLSSALGSTDVELVCRLTECEVPLDQLLSLEPGDVLTTSARVGDLAEILVENNHVGHARLGSHRGQLAVRFESPSP